MTSSIPMFQVSQIGPNSYIFYNSLTDPDGLIEKINNSSTKSFWINVGVPEDQCLDVKLNHEKSNLDIKDLMFSGEQNEMSLYILNSIKMAFWSTSDLYCKAYSIGNIKSESAIICKQGVSSIFDDELIKSDKFTAILFLNNSEDCSDTVVVDADHTSQFATQKGSVLIIPPGAGYKIGHFNDKDRYYCIYSFSTDII
jgi:hypothetical protein